MARISTHVLDIAKGAPAAGITVELYRADYLIHAAITNADGRTDPPLLSAEHIAAGTYELIFHCRRLSAGRAPLRAAVFRPDRYPLHSLRRKRKLSRAAAAGCSRLQHLPGIMSERAEKAIRYCRDLARCTEEPGRTTRTFLSPPMKDAHRMLGAWMRQVGMEVSVDAAGNLRAVKQGVRAGKLIIGSHLDTVPDAGAFDGILGVVLGVALVEALGEHSAGPTLEIIGFSEEEGVRFGIHLSAAGRLRARWKKRL